MTGGQNGWMDGMSVFVILWSHLDWNKFPWLFEIARFVCLAWEFLVVSSTQQSTFTTFPLHMDALFGFLRGLNDLYDVICWGNCILSCCVYCILYSCIFLSHFWHRQMHALNSGDGFQFWIKRGIIKESATFDAWTCINSHEVECSKRSHFIQVK